jgi:hypothetical protein
MDPLEKKGSNDLPQLSQVPTSQPRTPQDELVSELMKQQLQYWQQYQQEFPDFFATIKGESAISLAKAPTAADLDPPSAKLLKLCNAPTATKAFKENYRQLIQEKASISCTKFLDFVEKLDLVKAFMSHGMVDELVSVLNDESLEFRLPYLKPESDMSFIVGILEKGSQNLINQLFREDENIMEYFPFLLDSSQSLLYQKFLDAGYTPSESVISNSFKFVNYTILNIIFSKMDKASIIKNSDFFIKNLKASEDPEINSLFSKALKAKGITDYGNFVSDKLLSEAILEGRTEFVKWTFENGKEVKDIKKHLSEALSVYNLPMIRILFEYGRKHQQLQEKNYLEILGFGKPDKKDPDLLLAYAFHSPIGELRSVVEAYPYLKQYLKSTFQQIALIVRFPIYYQGRIDLKSHVSTLGETGAIPIDVNRNYAMKNLKALENIVSKLDKLTHEDLLIEIIKHRDAAFGLGSELYKTKAIKSVHTDLKWPDVYWYSLRHLMKVIHNPTKQSPFITRYPSLQIVGAYPTPSTKYGYINESNERIGDLSSFDNYQTWNHPDEKEIKKFNKTLETLHQELLDKNLSKMAFYEKIARYYYIMAKLSEYYRGTPHNVMMVLNIFYAYHGLPPPIPTLDNFFLDNTMLMLPEEEVIANWRSFFEGPILLT